MRTHAHAEDRSAFANPPNDSSSEGALGDRCWMWRTSFVVGSPVPRSRGHIPMGHAVGVLGGCRSLEFGDHGLQVHPI